MAYHRSRIAVSLVHAVSHDTEHKCQAKHDIAGRDISPRTSDAALMADARYLDKSRRISLVWSSYPPDLTLLAKYTNPPRSSIYSNI